MKNFLENLNKYFATPLVAILATVYGFYFESINKKIQSEGLKIDNIKSSTKT
jgi:hypothetical protein